MKRVTKKTTTAVIVLTLALLACTLPFIIMAKYEDEDPLEHSYGTLDVLEIIEQDVTIVNDGTILRNVVIAGDLYIEGKNPDENTGVSHFTTYLTRVEVEGTIYIEEGVRSVILNGSADRVVVRSDSGRFRLLNGTIGSLLVTPKAANSRIYVDKKGIIDEAFIATKCWLSGRGTIKTAAVSAHFVKVASGLIESYAGIR